MWYRMVSIICAYCFQWMWTEAALAYFKALSALLAEGLRKTFRIANLRVKV